MNNTNLSRFLSLIIAAVLLFSAFPLTVLSAYAQEADYAAAGDNPTSGTTGDCTWTRDGNELIISGNGKMADYTSKDASPWDKGYTKLTIKNGVTAIGDYAFRGSYNLYTVYIPDSVTSIGESAFERSTSLITASIGNSCTSIGDYAFRDCRSLVNLTVPDSVTSIGWDAFANTEWFRNQPDGLVYAGKVAYRVKGDCPPDVVIKEGTAGIAEGAFWACDTVKTVTIPDTVTIIKEAAFAYSSITSVSIGNSVTMIGYEAFKYCRKLSEVTLGNSVKEIDYYAFFGCRSLKSVTIPESVTTIGDSAFGYDDEGIIDSFIIYGNKGSEAERYANYNGITFTDVNDQPDPPYLLGDADGSGEVDMADATVIQRAVTKIVVPYDEEQLMRGDVDGDGGLTIVDATLIQRFATKVNTPYPIGEPVS